MAEQPKPPRRLKATVLPVRNRARRERALPEWLENVHTSPYVQDTLNTLFAGRDLPEVRYREDPYGDRVAYAQRGRMTFEKDLGIPAENEYTYTHEAMHVLDPRVASSIPVGDKSLAPNENIARLFRRRDEGVSAVGRDFPRHQIVAPEAYGSTNEIEHYAESMADAMNLLRFTGRDFDPQPAAINAGYNFGGGPRDPHTWDRIRMHDRSFPGVEAAAEHLLTKPIFRGHPANQQQQPKEQPLDLGPIERPAVRALSPLQSSRAIGRTPTLAEIQDEMGVLNVLNLDNTVRRKR